MVATPSFIAYEASTTLANRRPSRSRPQVRTTAYLSSMPARFEQRTPLTWLGYARPSADLLPHFSRGPAEATSLGRPMLRQRPRCLGVAAHAFSGGGRVLAQAWPSCEWFPVSGAVGRPPSWSCSSSRA
jgi:hypothetical protein